jgi:hypothetical protein
MSRDLTLLEEFRLEVDRIAKAETGCDWKDLCGEDEPLWRALECCETPREFVDWWIEKYDLERISTGEPPAETGRKILKNLYL